MLVRVRVLADDGGGDEHDGVEADADVDVDAFGDTYADDDRKKMC